VLRRIGIGIGATALLQVITALQTVALIPLFFRAWGVAQYGKWLVLTAFVSYLSLLDLGGQNYLVNLLTIHKAREQLSEFKQRFSQGVSFFLILGGTCFLFLLGLIVAARLFSVPLLGRRLEGWEAWVLALQSAIFLLFSVPGGVYATIYRATGLFVRAAMIGNIFRLLELFAAAVALWVAASPPVYTAVLLAMSLLTTAVVVWDSRRCIPEARELRLSWTAAKEGWKQLGTGSLQFWCISLARTINAQGLVLVAAATTHPAAVALYNTHRTLANIPAYLGGVVQAPVLPELSSLWAQGRWENLQRAAVLSLRAVTWLTGIGALIIWVTGPVLYPWWTGRRLTIDSVLLAIMLIQAVLSAGWTTASWPLLAANRQRSVALCSAGNALLTLVLAVWLARTGGVKGVALGNLVGDVVFGFLAFPLLLARFLRLGGARIYAAMGIAIVALFPLASLCILWGVVAIHWWSIAAFAGLSAVLTYPLTCIAVGRTETQNVFNRLKSKLTG
jgi:O-antigen/teichoic acid export membrane protein